MRTPLIVHIFGARPNFVKAAPVIAALNSMECTQVLIHTGQHYDRAMSDIFFAELGIQEPDINLGVGSGTQATQTGALLVGLETELVRLNPDAVVAYGDVNSTMAAALVCAKAGIPLVHVEAGLRSFDMSMPEEVNRRITDQLSDLLLVTSPEAAVNLGREGCEPDRVHFVGNTMIDTLTAHRDSFDAAPVVARYSLPERYAVVTMHRPGNVDDPQRAQAIVEALHDVAELVELVVPLHPRGRAQFEQAGLLDSSRVHVIEPLGYIEFLSLVNGARLVITDSGGLQEESTILGIPCLTVRPNTERPITISHGTNRLTTLENLHGYAQEALTGPSWQSAEAPPLWDGHAGPRCARLIMQLIGEREPSLQSL